MKWRCSLILVLTLVQSGPWTAAVAAEEPPSARLKGEKLLALHTEDAASYAIYRDMAREQRLVLRREPVYRWTNPTRNGGQEGDVFVWTYRGRPEAIGTIFSHPDPEATRVVNHELHSLSLAVLVVDREAPNRWVPQAAGVTLQPIPGAPVPATTETHRLVQLRTLAREFSGRSVGERGRTWELRLLPQPLIRYESTDLEVIDGALFAFVSSAGTDPEIVLLLEARRDAAGTSWFFGAARFSDLDLWLKHKNQDVWSSIRDSENTFNHDAKHRYRFGFDRRIPEISASDP